MLKVSDLEQYLFDNERLFTLILISYRLTGYMQCFKVAIL